MCDNVIIPQNAIEKWFIFQGFWEESGQMDKEQNNEAGTHCSYSSGVNTANSVSTPTQTILILVLPLIQTFTYPNLL